MSASIKRLVVGLVVASAVATALLTAVPSAQSATSCTAGSPCLPQNVGFISTITSGGAGAEFYCSSITVSWCVAGNGNSGSIAGVQGTSIGGPGVVGIHSGATGGVTLGAGVYGTTSRDDNSTGGVLGYNSSLGLSAVGVRGDVEGSGLGGHFTADGASGYGVSARGGFYGAFGYSTSADADAAGVQGFISSSAANAAGVRGDNNSVSCCGMGVAGFHAGQGIGVYGEAQNGFAVSGFSPNNWSGYFQGSVNVVGTLYKSSGAFRIDNPLDPAHSYLQHSFVESPDMMNVYNGNATTSGKGFATVKLPGWFQALNKDFRYQLTPLGHNAWGARVVVWEEIHNNRFTIRSEPNVKISWQITGIRHDPYANAHRIETVVAKQGSTDGRYVHPELYGRPLAKSVVVLPGMRPGTQPKLERSPTQR